MYFLIVLFTAGLSFTAGAIDDTPGGNLTFVFDFFPGDCVDVPSHLFACNKEVYEGRWYAKYVTYSASIVSNLSCLVWDTFFSKDDSFHDFLHTLNDGVVETFVSYSIPIPGKLGEYIQDGGSTVQNDTTIKDTLYYVDAEMMIYWDQICFDDGSKHTRNAVIGYRNLSMVPDKQPQLDRIMKTLENISGGPLTLRPIRHTRSCKYPPKMSNPYA